MSFPKIEDMTGAAFMSNGWSSFQALDKQMGATVEAQQSQMQLIAAAAARVAATGDGKLLLDHLLDVTLRRSPLPVEFGAGQPLTSDQITARILYREGQNAMVAAIMKLITDGQQAGQKQKKPAKER